MVWNLERIIFKLIKLITANVKWGLFFDVFDYPFVRLMFGLQMANNHGWDCFRRVMYLETLLFLPPLLQPLFTTEDKIKLNDNCRIRQQHLYATRYLTYRVIGYRWRQTSKETSRSSLNLVNIEPQLIHYEGADVWVIIQAYFKRNPRNPQWLP